MTHRYWKSLGIEVRCAIVLEHSRLHRLSRRAEPSALARNVASLDRKCPGGKKCGREYPAGRDIFDKET